MGALVQIKASRFASFKAIDPVTTSYHAVLRGSCSRTTRVP